MFLNVRGKYPATRADILGEWQQRAPEYGDFLKASVADAFERTTTATVMTEQNVMSAERERYGAHAPGYQDELLQASFGMSRYYDARETPEFIPQDAWDQHEFHRPGIAWQEHMTPERARIYAEEYDARELRKLLLEQGHQNYGFFKGTAGGFFAGVLGSLPDPINMVPFTGGFAAKSVRAGIAKGAAEGMIGNAVVDAVVLPDLNRRGADVGCADAALDMAFGAVLGGALGGGGAWLNLRRQARISREVEAAMEAARYRARELAAHQELHGEFAHAGRDRLYETDINAPFEPLDSFLFRDPQRDAARQITYGEQRRSYLRAFGLAQEQLHAGEGVNVSQVLKESRALEQLYEQALFNPLFSTDPHSHSVRLMYAELADSLDVRLGDIYVDIGTALAKSSGEIKIRSAFGMIKFIWKHGEASNKAVTDRVTREDILNFPRILREYVPLFERGGYGWLVQTTDGRYVYYVAKNFFETTKQDHLVTLHVIPAGKVQDLGGVSKKIADLASLEEGFRPSYRIQQGELRSHGVPVRQLRLSRSSPGQESANLISNIASSSSKVKVRNVNASGSASKARQEEQPIGEQFRAGIEIADLASPAEGSKSSARIRQGELKHRNDEASLVGRGPSRSSPGQESAILNKNIRPLSSEVKWTTERADVYEPAPPVQPERPFAPDHITPEELRARELADSGRAAPEDLEAMQAAKDAETTVNRMEDAGLAALECLLGKEK